jgi:hypothetical protein
MHFLCIPLRLFSTVLDTLRHPHYLSQMLIQEKPLQHWIDHFYGYGSWQAPIWFIGYEEGGGDAPEEVAEKLNYFYKAHANAESTTLCDIRELYQHVAFRVEGPRAEKFSNLYDYRFGAKTKTLHGAWKNLIAFQHAFRNKKVPNLLSYQKNTFLTSSSREALLQLYPLPAHNHAWYYSWLDLSPKFKFLKTRALYEAHVFPERMKNILTNIKTYKPEVVVMYGMENINALKQSVQEVFPAVKFSMVKGIKLVIPQHHITELGETILVITTQLPSLRHQRVETGFDWEEFGKLVRASGK